jgi:formylglycine-generating enzyme
MKARTEFHCYLAIVCMSVACGSSGSSSGSGVGGSVASGGKSGTGGASGATVGGSISTGGSGASGGKSSGGSNAAGNSGTGGSTDSGFTPPSCQSSGPGLSDCGASGESCCTSLKVPGDTFYRTYTNDGSGAKNTADPATISDFRLDKYMVTVGRFRKFVSAWDQGSGYTPDVGSGKHAHLNGGKGLADSGAPGAYEAGWINSYTNKLDMSNDTLDCQSNMSTWTSSPGAKENLPMNCINWFEAYAFCIWDGGFLASEAEYVYAAAGGSEQRRFPWGSTEPGKDNQYAIWNCDYPDGSGTCDGTIRNIAKVGSAKLGAGRWGQLDLVGELIQWYLDWYLPSYVNPCTDCANLADGSGRAPRDGYFGSSDQTLLQSSYRNNGFYPANRFSSYGFRCARTP